VSDPLLALLGPTASGKTEAAVPLAEALGAEIVSVDSMLVYRGMDVGTAKPTLELRARVPHHLVDLVGPAEPFSVRRFQELAKDAIAGIRERGARPLLVGSGGLYFRAVADDLEFPATEGRVRRLLETEAGLLGPGGLHRRLVGIDPAAAARIGAGNDRRVVRALEVAAVTGRPFSSFATRWERYRPGAVLGAGIDVPRAALHGRIEARVRAMLPGLLAEANELRARGFGRFLTASQAIGYAEAVACLDGRMSPEDVAAGTIRRTKALARRQLSWLRRDPRITWFRAGEDGAAGVLPELVSFFSASRRGAMARAEG
jgi:tRNA dimethylallyltransferase